MPEDGPGSARARRTRSAKKGLATVRAPASRQARSRPLVRDKAFQAFREPGIAPFDLFMRPKLASSGSTLEDRNLPLGCRQEIQT